MDLKKDFSFAYPVKTVVTQTPGLHRLNINTFIAMKSILTFLSYTVLSALLAGTIFVFLTRLAAAVTVISTVFAQVTDALAFVAGFAITAWVADALLSFWRNLSTLVPVIKMLCPSALMAPAPVDMAYHSLSDYRLVAGIMATLGSMLSCFRGK